MASTAGATSWLRGRVKAVPSGDCLVITGSSKAEFPPEKTITLASIVSPRLARRGGVDEPFAWDSREYLRKLCIGKDVTFKVDYTVPSIGREFGSVFLGDKNVALLVVSEGWAKVREQGQQKGEASPFLAELQRFEEQAKQQGIGRWSKVPGASEASIRNLPPSAIGDPSNLDAMGLLAANKGRPMQGIVEQVRDGSTVRVYLLPDFQFVQVFVAGIQSPSMGRRAVVETVIDSEVTSDEPNGEASGEPRLPLTSAQRLVASATSSTEVSPDPFGREAKHFTEIRVLNRDVRIVLEGVDKFSNLIGSVYYPDGDSAKDLALELVENGLAKYVDWSANMMEEDARRQLKSSELQAKKDRLRIWTNFVPPPSNSKAIHDQNFTGKVVEVVSGDCMIVADDSVPYGSPLAERRVNLSSVRSPKMGNPRRDEKPAAYAREAREFLRTRLIGRQVNVSMEYSRKVTMADGSLPTASSADSRVMDFGSVFLVSSSKVDADDAVSAPPSAGSQPVGINVAELVVGRGFGTVIRHRDFEERSNYYDALIAAEARAIAGKKGIHSAKDSPVMHITDLTMASVKKAKDFLPFLQRSRRLPAIVDYVLSGHRFKLLIPKETCSIAFSFSGVRCPGRDELFSDEAMALMRRKILQRDVEIEVEMVDRTGTFLGSLWEGKTNMVVPLLEAGLARLQTAFGTDRIPDAYLLEQAEQSAKRQRLKIWENYVEGQEVANGSTVESKQKEVLKVKITEVLGGGRFYVQTVEDQRVASIQRQLASLNLQEAPVIGAFNPKKGDIVLAQFTMDNSWNRAMIVNAPRGAVESPKDLFEVFYIDYGNQEEIPYSRLRPLDPSVSSGAGLAQLCSLAYIKIPSLEEDFGQEAAEYLSQCILDNSREFRAMVEEKDTSGGKVKGQGTGTILYVTLVDVEASSSINAAMLQEGLARLERMKRWDTRERQQALDNLEEFQAKAKRERLKMWQYGDIQSDDEDSAPPVRKAAGRR
ncbi:ribonuclease TUDOR 1 [Macadamia integrifolia]|uniref:ribonuclease TUDOR 1 n=1 Tax=Macadamia integrifolia TaxID=60698 RepID=UPI001C4F208B|nr:ribonuclease TUDOR 1 [Macadamia integrifolia]XP_042498410.1 ribonuclease TUDOR 1 [Macadamia integrifolia]XP_042498411.1 ribonuclease TUDOR 1 [Macadamia integrifolia]